MATRNQRTFSLQTPEDLYEKLHYEALLLYNQPPENLVHRAYAVMNTVTTAWQMKDWVYATLAAVSALDRLDVFAGRRIDGPRDFGAFLTERSPWMRMCFQLATATKHFEVRADTGFEVVTSIDFQIEPGDTASDLQGREEIMVRTRNNSISGPDLVLLLDYIWSRALLELGLLTHRNPDEHG